MAIASLTHVSGAYQVLWDVGGDERSLGQTESGFTLEISQGPRIPITEDQFGAMIIDGLFPGVEAMILRIESVNFTDEILEAGLPWSEDTSSLMTGGGATKAGFQPGMQYIADGLAKQLDLNSMIAHAAASPRDDWILWRAVAVGPVTLNFSAKAIRRVPMEFMIYPKTDGEDAGIHRYFTRSAAGEPS